MKILRQVKLNIISSEYILLVEKKKKINIALKYFFEIDFTRTTVLVSSEYIIF